MEPKLLSQVKSGLEAKSQITLVFGTPKVGKTGFAAEAPDNIFLPVGKEAGLANVNCHKFPPMKEFSHILDAAEELHQIDHRYKNITIDGLGGVQDLIHQAVCKKAGKPTMESFQFGRGYALAQSYWDILIDSLSMLRDEKGMGIILTCQSRVEEFNNPETEPYSRFVPALHKLANQKVLSWVDQILFCTYKVYVQTSDKAKNRGIGSGERVVRTTERPSYVAGNRLGLPDEIPMVLGKTWNTYSSYFPTSKREVTDGKSK